MRSSKIVLLPVVCAAGLLLASCSSSNQVDLNESKRFLGRENDVRVDAQLFTDQLDNASLVRVVYEVENLRAHPIALADATAETDYDPASQTITLNIGCEIPGKTGVPRLTKIESGERKGFGVGAKFNIVVANSPGPFAHRPRHLRVKLHFLGEVTPFETLLVVPEKRMNNAAAADAIFPIWIEKKESVITNTLPIHWGGEGASVASRFGGTF